MGVFKKGDFVYIVNDVEEYEGKQLFTNSGMILDIDEKERKYTILCYKSIGYSNNSFKILSVNENNIRSLSDRDLIIQEIENYINGKINKLQAEIEVLNKAIDMQNIEGYGLLGNKIKKTIKEDMKGILKGSNDDAEIIQIKLTKALVNVDRFVDGLKSLFIDKEVIKSLNEKVNHVENLNKLKEAIIEGLDNSIEQYNQLKGSN